MTADSFCGSADELIVSALLITATNLRPQSLLYLQGCTEVCKPLWTVTRVHSKSPGLKGLNIQ